MWQSRRGEQMAAKERWKRRSARTEAARWLNAAVRRLNGVIVTAASKALNVKIKDGKAEGKLAESEFTDRRLAPPEDSVLLNVTILLHWCYKAQQTKHMLKGMLLFSFRGHLHTAMIWGGLPDLGEFCLHRRSPPTRGNVFIRGAWFTCWRRGEKIYTYMNITAGRMELSKEDE